MKSLLFSRCILLLLLFYLVPLTLVCASNNDQPETVYSVIYVQKPNGWYISQADLWKAEIDKDPQNADAWRNYYSAVRYARYTETIKTKEKRERLREIIDEMGRAIPNTYEYYYLKNKNDGDINNIEYLQKAYEIDPDNPELYSDFVGHYEFVGNEKKMEEFLDKWYTSQELAPGLLHYNYNVLMSTAKNAVLFTNGDNDTYPIWMLQKIKKVRTDVTVLNVSLMMAKKEYLDRKLREKGIKLNYDELPAYRTQEFVSALGEYIAQNYSHIPVYFALTLWGEYFAPIKDNLYIVGLAYKFSTERLDNTALIQKNIQNFRLDYLSFDWYSENYLATSLMHKLNLNYVASMVSLVEHYYQSGESDKAKFWADKALALAEKAGYDEELLKDLEKKGITLK